MIKVAVWQGSGSWHFHVRRTGCRETSPTLWPKSTDILRYFFQRSTDHIRKIWQAKLQRKQSIQCHSCRVGTFLIISSTWSSFCHWVCAELHPNLCIVRMILGLFRRPGSQHYVDIRVKHSRLASIRSREFSGCGKSTLPCQGAATACSLSVNSTTYSAGSEHPYQAENTRRPSLPCIMIARDIWSKILIGHTTLAPFSSSAGVPIT